MLMYQTNKKVSLAWTGWDQCSNFDVYVWAWGWCTENTFYFQVNISAGHSFIITWQHDADMPTCQLPSVFPAFTAPLFPFPLPNLLPLLQTFIHCKSVFHWLLMSWIWRIHYPMLGSWQQRTWPTLRRNPIDLTSAFFFPTIVQLCIHIA